MKIAVLSDIHSNSYALSAVLKEMDSFGVTKTIILGDFFGYYPWAVETYKMLSGREIIAVKGNHDIIVQENAIPEPALKYGGAAKDNQRQLSLECPASLNWLKGLECKKKIAEGKIKLLLFHGTPDDPCSGRFYPDNPFLFDWFPVKNEIILLGHTHYPLYKHIPRAGIIINPGSVGQPRDGNPYPCWCILDLENLSISWQRTKYNYMEAVRELEKLNWERRSVLALQKTYKGNLKLE